uniref:Uncharacterized protein n=1 Tax=Globodera rostochiensis TaxID=31243 RepID=A0A914HEJ4_GLORO
MWLNTAVVLLITVFIVINGAAVPKNPEEPKQEVPSPEDSELEVKVPSPEEPKQEVPNPEEPKQEVKVPNPEDSELEVKVPNPEDSELEVKVPTPEDSELEVKVPNPEGHISQVPEEHKETVEQPEFAGVQLLREKRLAGNKSDIIELFVQIYKMILQDLEKKKI